MSPVRHAPAELTAGDTALRAQYLHEVLDILYPDTSVTANAPKTRRDRPTNSGPVPRDKGPAAPPNGLPAAASGVPAQAGGAAPGNGRTAPAGEEPAPNVIAEYLIIPDARRPRLLVPANDRKIAAAAVRRYAEPTSRTARLKRNAVVAALRTGASTVLLRDRVSIIGAPRSPLGTDSIDLYLARVLGATLSVSVHIGPARANRKPVLQLLSETGDTVGFGKLGTGALTRGLVRAETTALATLAHAKLATLTVPRVLHSGQWRGHEVLVQSALPIWLPRATVTTKRLVAAMKEVAGCLGTATGSLAGNPYWKTLRERLEKLNTPSADPAVPRPDGTDATAEAGTLSLAADELVAHAGHVELTFGAWHGDWAPWNMAATTGALLVWDWERFAPGVPIGFDALHYDLQRLLDRGVAPGPAVDTTTARAARLLTPYGVDKEAAIVTSLLYLVELATRYLEDRQAEAGARLGVLGNWLLPVLTAKVGAL